MKLEQYRQETLRTMADLEGLLINSIHMSLGMFTETAEIIEVLSDEVYDPYRLCDEISDVLWYLSNYTNLYNYSLKQETETIIIPGFLENRSMIDCIIILVARLADVDKKQLAYGKIKEGAYQASHAQWLFNCIHMFCVEHQLNIEDVMERNIDKLRVRFPEKFSGEQAINKDESKEKEVFHS